MIKANFDKYNSYVSDSVYQWDTNQILSISGLNLTEVPEIHFANANMEKALIRQATISNGVISVNIPNSLLQQPVAITAYIGLYNGNVFTVVEKVLIPVIPRKRPADYVIENTDEEIYSFAALENMIANLTDRIKALENTQNQEASE